MRLRAAGRFRPDRGSVSVELSVLVPTLMLILGLLIAGGRIWFAKTTVNEAAQTAARAASLARSAEGAAVAGGAAGRQSMATEGLSCRDGSVSVNTAAFAVPVGTPATITSTIQCRVRLSDLVLPGLPGSIQLSGAGSAALDTYRSRASGFMNSEGLSGANLGGG